MSFFVVFLKNLATACSIWRYVGTNDFEYHNNCGRSYMIKRITITLDETLESKIRTIQAQRITKQNKSISFSQVLNQLLKSALDNGNYNS